MTWPPEGSKPPSPPRPAGETTGETKVKPQTRTGEAKPPQFQHDGIDPLRAALILGLPLLVAAGAGLFLIASPALWWIAGGLAAAGVAGGVLLRRSKKARAALRRLPGAGRVASALRRTRDGRFSRSPLGRVLRSRSAGTSSGGPASRPKTLGGRLRAMLPSWAGGTRKASSSNRPGGPSGGRPAGRMRSLLNRLKPGGARRPGASGGGSGGTSPKGSKPKPKSLLGRAASSARNTAAKASRAAASKLFRIRRTPSSASSSGGSSKPSGKGKSKPSGSGGSRGKDTTLDLGVVWTGAGKAGRLVGRGVGALLRRMRRRRNADEDDFDLNSTYEIGIEGEVINGKHTDPDLGEIAERARKQAAKRARKQAKKRAKQAKKDADPEWPNVDVDELPAAPEPPQWPDTDADDAPESTQPPKRSLPTERDHDPPPARELPKRPQVEDMDAAVRNSPRGHASADGHVTKLPPGGVQNTVPPTITSTNTGGKAMSVSPTKYNDLITNATSRREGWQEAADAFRRDSAELNEKAKEHDEAARIFKSTGNHAAAEEREDEARKLRDDANTCLTYAAKMQEKANAEVPAA